MTFETQGSLDRRSPVHSVIEVVADCTETDPLELPPLYETVDPDALDAVVDGLDRGQISFEYAGQFVTVHGDESIDVSAAPAGGSAREEPETDG